MRRHRAASGRRCQRLSAQDRTEVQIRHRPLRQLGHGADAQPELAGFGRGLGLDPVDAERGFWRRAGEADDDPGFGLRQERVVSAILQRGAAERASRQAAAETGQQFGAFGI